jgi:hypothetical protein
MIRLPPRAAGLLRPVVVLIFLLGILLAMNGGRAESAPADRAAAARLPGC